MRRTPGKVVGNSNRNYAAHGKLHEISANSTNSSLNKCKEIAAVSLKFAYLSMTQFFSRWIKNVYCPI